MRTMSWLGTRSIATRLFLSAAFWSSLILILAGLILSAINRRSAETDFDERLGVYLKALVADVASPAPDNRANPGQLGEPMFEFPLSGWYWQITRLDGASGDVKPSPSLFAERLPKLADLGVAAEAGGTRRGYAIGPDDRRLRIVERIIDVSDGERYLVQVAASPEDVEVDIATFNLALGLTFTLLALALVASTALQVRFGLRPLRRLSASVAAIRQGAAERIDGRFPPEIAPIAGELNLLIASNRQIVERSRTHVGNLAHALKTPLSVIFNEAASLEQAPDAAALAARVRDQAQTMREQVTWYLDRARAVARSSVIGTATEVKPAVTALVRTFGKIYVDRGIAFTAEVADGLRFRGEKQDFEDLVGNLVDNAGKWAATRVDVAVAPAREPGEAGPSILVVTVDDDGPGLPTGQRELATRRGRRLDESKPGSGLGLSIVADLADAYGGSFELHDSPLGGLRATLRLPGSRVEYRAAS